MKYLFKNGTVVSGRGTRQLHYDGENGNRAEYEKHKRLCRA